MSTRWIVATGLSGETNARRENPHGHFTAGTSSSCVISNFFFAVFFDAAVVAGGVMVRRVAPKTSRTRCVLSKLRSGGGEERVEKVGRDRWARHGWPVGKDGASGPALPIQIFWRPALLFLSRTSAATRLRI